MLPISERFHSFQGEGVHMGRAAFFIRTFGCPQHCPWCDSAGTWHSDYVPKKVMRMSPQQLVEEAVASNARFVVITGGEPTIHDLNPLVYQLHMAGIEAHLETSGSHSFAAIMDWVTLSPKDKWAKPALSRMWELADEIKLIIETPEDLPYWATILASPRYHGQPVWLHPEWSKRGDAALLTAITEWVRVSGDPYRAGWQMHKLYKADTLDARSAAPVPLGGNPALGY